MDIVVEHITKRYGPQKAVDDVSFAVRTGEILGFLGPNGAGKSTTMKAITCYLAPNEGNIMVGGISIYDDPQAIKNSIGYLPESNPLYTDMPVINYLQFIARIHGIEKNQVNKRIAAMVEVCGLEGEKHKKIGELSKGFRQRVGLAQALIHDPEVLVLDEPTTGLDPNQIVEIRELIRKIGKEKTVLLSSHILAEVEATCDRILIINKGKIVADGTASDLRKRAEGKEILKTGVHGGEEKAVQDALRGLTNVEMVEMLARGENLFEVHSKVGQSSVKEIFDLCVDRGWYLTQLTPTETRLEDIFRELTAN
ncbi:MAG: ATP-binding cassette domain-containing protein [Bacteroidales bacterium]|nr:ATP-binding cassette domain-containing protein [Bacteroidales bacterium]